ncbi:MAG: pilin [Candidatus Parcubacteria bacterium]|nr:pilin [Candidatus Parcubacteria bacterium]
MKTSYLLLILLLVSILGSQATMALAQPLNLSNVNGFINQTGEGAGIKTETSLPGLAAQIIQVLLGLLGIAFVLMIIYGGFLYLTSLGEESKIKKAKDLLKLAVIGFLIVMTAYAVTLFIATTLETSLQ